MNRYLHSIFSIHFPPRIPSNTLRVLLHAPFSSVDAMTCVTLVSHFFKTVTPDDLSKSETVSCNSICQENNANQSSFETQEEKTKLNSKQNFFTLSGVVRAEQQRTNFFEDTQKFQFLPVLLSGLLETQRL